MARPKQKLLSEEMGPKLIKEIVGAAEDYVDARDRRMALLKTEIAHRDNLVNLMKKHGLTEYEFDGQKVEFESTTTEKIRVRLIKSKDEDGDGDKKDDGF